VITLTGSVIKGNVWDHINRPSYQGGGDHINRFNAAKFLCLCQGRTKDSRGRDRMVVGFKTTCAISAYHL
jgi:hypothetical protein